MVIATKDVTTKLAEYAMNLRFEDIPLPVIQRTKQLFLDFLGVALGGYQVADSTKPTIDAVRELANGSPGTSTIIGEEDLFPAHYAALANGTLAHSMDFDDTHRAAIMHPGAPLFATLLALAEERRSSGRELLVAAVAGYDIGNKLGKAHGPKVHHKGFHPTATTGIFACTSAGGRLLGLSYSQMLSALGLNNSQIAGTQQFLEDGSWNKRVHTGLAAHNSILSLVMARNGVIGAREPIEGRFGYFALYTSEPSDPSSSLEGLGSEFEVMNTAIKPYPCCRYSHATIDAVIDLVTENNLTSNDITSIEIEMGKTGYNLVAHPVESKRQPSSVVDGQFSIYFAAATAATHGCYSWDSYRFLRAPELQNLMHRTTVNEVGNFLSMESRVTLTTSDGRQLAREVLLPKGEPENPLTWNQIQAKFTEWAEGVLGQDNTRAIIEQVNRLETLDDLSALTKLVRP